jgi:thymidylate synthase (FAD)
MENKIKVLDNGYVKFIESWGKGEAGQAEAGIIEAARQSTQGSFRGWETDEKLLSYLYKNKHSTPFEFCGMTIEIQAPIFVFREWHRHRTQSYNEMSARYGPLPNLNYLPSIERLFSQDTTNKQAQSIKGSEELTFDFAEEWLNLLENFYQTSENLYKLGLDNGIPKELARLVNPVGRYSKMRATANLRNWLGFITLRSAKDAQEEIRNYSDTVGYFIEREFPKTWNLFINNK